MTIEYQNLKVAEKFGPHPLAPRDPAKALRARGWLQWGVGNWIHESDLGTVVSEAEALKQEGLG